MLGDSRDCHRCDYGKPTGQCALHKKKQNPDRKKRKRDKKLNIEHGCQERDVENECLKKATELANDL